MLAELSIVEHSDKYVVCQVVGTSASICITSEEFAYIRKNDKTSWINTLKLAIGGIIDTQAGPGPEALDPTLPGQVALPGTGPDTPIEPLLAPAQASVGAPKGRAGCVV